MIDLGVVGLPAGMRVFSIPDVECKSTIVVNDNRLEVIEICGLT